MRYSEVNKAIGKNLQKLRKEKGYKSAKEFAAALDININTYTDIEQGKTGLSLERAWQIADLLNCSLDEVGGRTPPPKPLAHSPAETELISYYRQCTPPRRQIIYSTAADNALLSVGAQKSGSNIALGCVA